MAEPNVTRRDAPPQDQPRQSDVPDTPTDLGRGSWLAAGRRSVQEFKDDFLQDRAAALTYYSIQSIFPALLVLVSLTSAGCEVIGDIFKAGVWVGVLMVVVVIALVGFVAAKIRG